MEMRVNLGKRSYDIIVQRGLLDRAGTLLKPVLRARRVLLLTDETVDALYGARAERALTSAGFETARMALPAGEATKCLDMLGRVYARMAQEGLARSDALVALGGGVIGDLGGMAAATFLRGLDYVQIPTTLLAQVDSSVGGKVAIDLPAGKNLAGCFCQPRRVLIDPDVLETLSDRVFCDGMGEVIKYGCIADRELFDRVAACAGRSALMPHIEWIIGRSLDIKRDVVERDEYDTGGRMVLNFGHTLGHAIEAAQHYAGMTHGEAVAAGMLLITRLSQEKGLTCCGTAEQLERCLRAWHLPCGAERTLWNDMRAALALDKKHLEGALTCILLDSLGSARLHRTDLRFFDDLPRLLD